jgi:integrase
MSPKTIANYHGLLFAMFRQAVREGLRTTNPCEGVKLPSRNDDIEDDDDKTFLTEGEFTLLRNCLDADVADFVLVAVATGLRWGELTALQVRTSTWTWRYRPSVSGGMEAQRSRYLPRGRLRCDLPRRTEVSPVAPAGQPDHIDGGGTSPGIGRQGTWRAGLHRTRRRPAESTQLLQPSLAARAATRTQGGPDKIATIPRPAPHARGLDAVCRGTAAGGAASARPPVDPDHGRRLRRHPRPDP